jgi:hypothetical protein
MGPVEGPLRDRMIFLVGARRSGTNWVQRVIGAHSQVALVPSETYLFSRGIKPLRERFHHGVLGSPGTAFVYMDLGEMTRALRNLCDGVFLPFLKAVPGATRLVERTPEHVSCLELIGEIYPDAWILNILRDGRDVARSLMTQPWKNAPQTIEEAAMEWRSSVEAAEAASAGLERFRTVRYEEMLVEPEAHVAELFGWLGLSATPPLVEEALREAKVVFNQDPTTGRVGAGKWREKFSEMDLNALMKVAGGTLERLGYLDPDSAAPSTRTAATAAAPPSESPRRRLRGRLRRRERAQRARNDVSQITDIQRTVDRIAAAVVGRRANELDDSLLRSVLVRVVAPSGDWKGRGAAAWDRLAEETRNDPALDGRQISGDLHPGVPTSTAVMKFAAPDGSLHLRILAATIEGGRLARLTYYRFALESDAGR